MQNKDVEIFLELVLTRNISKTAENLFLSQSVISTRLKSLEEELGYELFSRARGVREIELTKAGREFVSVATRMRNLYTEAELLGKRTRHSLRLASPESVYYDFLEPIVLKLHKENPELRVSLLIKDSSEIYELMKYGQISFGFASYESSHSDILRSHIFSQEMCLVVGEGSFSDKRVISPRELDPEKEVHLSGGNFSNVAKWHNKWFKEKSRSRIEVNSPHMIVSYLSEPGGWTILPRATAEILSGLYGITICELTDAPESRKIYLLKHVGSEYSDGAAKMFEDALSFHLKEIQNL